MTPGGVAYEPLVYGAETGDGYAQCYVVKESGDDPDITAGIHIYARVELTRDDQIEITGGIGIGKVSRPGLDQPVGEYAINSVPRKMIREELEALFCRYDYEGGARVTIFAPKGEEIAVKTFNSHMGILGGISIIGTSGIVEPMSTKALIDTIKLDIRMQYLENPDLCIMAPGNYGETFLSEKYGIDSKRVVLFSNYFGDSLRLARDEGFNKVLLCSHIGKLIKVSGGMMNTHSMYGDKRMELMNENYRAVCEEGNIAFDEDLSRQIAGSVSTTAVLDLLPRELIPYISKRIVREALFALKRHTDNELLIDLIMYDNKYGELARAME